MLSWVDIGLLVIVGLSAVVGLWRGFLVEVASILVWGAAFWLAFVYGADVAPLFEHWVAAPSARLFLGYALLFVAALVIGGLATWLLGRVVKSTGLSGTDRLLGLVFGLLRGFALGCVLVLLFGFTPMPADPWWKESRLLPGFQSGAEWMREWLPATVAEHVDFTPMQMLPGGLLPALPGQPEPDAPVGTEHPLDNMNHLQEHADHNEPAN